MLIDNFSKEAIEIDIHGNKLVLLPGKLHNIPESSIPADIVEDMSLGNIEGVRITSEYPSVTLKAL